MTDHRETEISRIWCQQIMKIQYFDYQREIRCWASNPERLVCTDSGKRAVLGRIRLTVCVWFENRRRDAYTFRSLLTFKRSFSIASNWKVRFRLHLNLRFWTAFMKKKTRKYKLFVRLRTINIKVLHIRLKTPTMIRTFPGAPVRQTIQITLITGTP